MTTDDGVLGVYHGAHGVYCMYHLTNGDTGEQRRGERLISIASSDPHIQVQIDFHVQYKTL